YPTLVEIERRFLASVAYKRPDRRACCTTPRSRMTKGEPAEAFIPLAALVVLPRSERVVMLGEVPAAQVAVLIRAGARVDRRPVPWGTDDAAASRSRAGVARPALAAHSYQDTGHPALAEFGVA